jgi:threonine/homoserine/homoserine lactone efflux protein
VLISQTLQHGAVEGFKVASAPLMTDLPIICIALLLFYNLSDLDFALGLTSFAGAALVLLLGVQNLRAEPREYPRSLKPARSYTKGFLVNALSPHPYLFWFSVGVPTIIKLAQDSIDLAIVFLLSFFACLIGAKVMIAILIGHSREIFSGAAYLWLMRVMGLGLIGFSLILVRDGIRLTGAT